MPKGIYPRHVKRHAITQPLDTSYRLIPLSQNQNALVDAADFGWLSRWHWHAWWNTATRSFYATRTERSKTGKLTRIWMHLEILGRGVNEQGDHENHNTLDNRRKNLRSCTLAQNCWNRRMRQDNTSGYRGVWRDKGKWRVRIIVNRKRITLGQFDDPKIAALTYNKAAKKYHGAFASLNIIE